MIRPLLFSLLISLFCANASAKEPSRHMVFAGYGVPVPLKILGYGPSLDGSDFRVKFMYSTKSSYHFGLWKNPLLGVFVGALFGASGVVLTDDEMTPSGNVLKTGLEALLRFSPGKSNGWDFGIGGGPTFVFTVFKVDENMKEKTYGVGLQSHLYGSRLIWKWLRVSLDIGIEYAFTPSGDPTFFNAPLKDSSILTFLLGPLIYL